MKAIEKFQLRNEFQMQLKFKFWTWKIFFVLYIVKRNWWTIRSRILNILAVHVALLSVDRGRYKLYFCIDFTRKQDIQLSTIRKKINQDEWKTENLHFGLFFKLSFVLKLSFLHFTQFVIKCFHSFWWYSVFIVPISFSHPLGIWYWKLEEKAKLN